VDNARKGFFSDVEMGELLRHLPDYLRPFIEAACITGWRRGELGSRRWTQVDWESGTIRFERGMTKSGEPRSFPFAEHPRLSDLLQELRDRTSEAFSDGAHRERFLNPKVQAAWLRLVKKSAECGWRRLAGVVTEQEIADYTQAWEAWLTAARESFGPLPENDRPLLRRPSAANAIREAA
jgi:integrase